MARTAMAFPGILHLALSLPLRFARELIEG